LEEFFLLLDPLIAFGVAMAICIGGVIFVFHMAKIERESQARIAGSDRSEGLPALSASALHKDAA
jgi:hypothetical protein